MQVYQWENKTSREQEPAQINCFSASKRFWSAIQQQPIQMLNKEPSFVIFSRIAFEVANLNTLVKPILYLVLSNILLIIVKKSRSGVEMLHKEIFFILDLKFSKKKI